MQKKGKERNRVLKGKGKKEAIIGKGKEHNEVKATGSERKGNKHKWKGSEQKKGNERNCVIRGREGKTGVNSDKRERKRA